MIEKDLDKVLNYMKQYVENKYEHNSEPMLTWKDLKLVLNEIDRLNNIINELEKWLKFFNENGLVIDLEEGKQTTVMPTLAILEKIQELKGSDKE